MSQRLPLDAFKWVEEFNSMKISLKTIIKKL